MKHKDMFSRIRSSRSEREKIIRLLYEDKGLQNGIKTIIKRLGGTDDDFNNIFNFTLVQFLKNVLSKADLCINTNVNSYLFGIARNLWLQELRKRKRLPDSLPEDFVAADNSPAIDLIMMNEEKYLLLRQILDQLGKNCKEVLMLWAENFKMKEIAGQLNYKSEGVVRKKKLNCKEELAKYIDAHPTIKKFLIE